MVEDRDYGPGWVKSTFKGTEMSTLGEDVARLLNDLYVGIYHIQRECSRVDWSNQTYIEIILYGAWCSFDHSNLTRLIFLAHDYGLRVQLEARAPGYVRLMFHRRTREGNLYMRHPSIEFALAQWRESHEDQLR